MGKIISHTRVYTYRTHRHACQQTDTDSHAHKSRTHIETLLLHFDRDLFGHTLCASCQPSSTAAI